MEMESAIVCCHECKFWESRPMMARVSGGGFCHRHAPQPRLVELGKETADQMYVAEWPITTMGEGACGEGERGQGIGVRAED